MDNLSEKIKQLEDRLQELAKQQNTLNLSLFNLSDEMNRLKRSITEEKKNMAGIPGPQQQPAIKEITITPYAEQDIKERIAAIGSTVKKPAASKGFEELIGGNIASKVGILVTIIGVFIGAKYAIDKELISPAVRIILGYCAGAGLTVLALFLKKKYINYSAVLLSGGLAVLYFISYIAYSYYQLMPQTIAFGIMLIITAAGVYASLLYSQVIIAHIGMIGAYAIPFLLSNNSGQYQVLFSYIAIINTGILIIAFKKYWKSLFYIAFAFTWLIYFFWYIGLYNQTEHYTIAWLFTSIFFIQFYGIFLAYKLIKKEQYGSGDIIILLCNSFIVYAFGYALLQDRAGLQNLAGAFTLLNAALHFCVALTVRYCKLSDKALLYMILGLVMAFVTITIPVQFNGNWVTLLWAAESLMMFWIGRTKQNAVYEKIAGVLSVLTIISQAQDWVNYISMGNSALIPFANIYFFSGLLVALGFSGIVYIHSNKKFIPARPKGYIELNYWNWILPLLFVLTVYITGYIELKLWCDKIYRETTQEAWQGYTVINLLCYSFYFVYILAAINYYKIKNISLARSISVVLAVLFLLGVTLGFTTSGSLRNIYLHNNTSHTIHYNAYHYFLFLTLLAGLAVARYWLLTSWTDKSVSKIFSLMVHTVILTMISNEYIHWMTLLGYSNQYKLGLSIIWGIYALLMTVLGIWKKKKYVRLAAIGLFTATLLKLFFYDLTGLNTIAKTISFISLGIILLLVSYLYNRYKHVILMEDEEP